MRAGLLAFCLFLTTNAAAQSTRFSLNWVRAPGAEDCLSSVQLASAVERIVGPVFAAPADAQRVVEGFVERSGSPATLHVRTRVTDARGRVLGERLLESASADCQTLTASIVLVVALTIDSEAGSADLPPALLAELSASSEDPARALLSELEANGATHAAAIEPAAEPAPAPPAVVAEPAPAAERKLAGELSLHAGLSQNIMPRLGMGIGVNGRLHTAGPVSFTLAASYWLPRSASERSVDNTQIEAKVQAAQTELAACMRLFALPTLRAHLCAGAALGLRFVSTPASPNAGPPHVYSGPLASLDLQYALSERWFARLQQSVAVPLPRATYGYTDRLGMPHAIFERPRLAGWTSLQIGIRL